MNDMKVPMNDAQKKKLAVLIKSVAILLEDCRAMKTEGQISKANCQDIDMGITSVFANFNELDESRYGTNPANL